MQPLAAPRHHPTQHPLIPLATQLHILNLFGGDETPYESLHAVVSCGVKPWFDDFIGARGTGKDDSKMGECRLMTVRARFTCHGRYPNDEEEICRTRALPSPLTAKRRNSGDSPRHPPRHSESRRTGASRVGSLPTRSDGLVLGSRGRHTPKYLAYTAKITQ
jgi:hypothetical protein